MKTLIETILARAFESGRLQNQPPANLQILIGLMILGRQSAAAKTIIFSVTIIKKEAILIS
jgi:hypothetical protein